MGKPPTANDRGFRRTNWPSGSTLEACFPALIWSFSEMEVWGDAGLVSPMLDVLLEQGRWREI